MAGAFEIDIVADDPVEAVREYVRARVAIEDRGYETPCWIWQLSLNCGGYGQGRAPGAPRVDQAHRFSYRAFVGEIPAGLHLDHLCRVRACCNPEHLEPVTPEENNRRARPFAKSHVRTRCKRGHELIGDNAIADPRGGRRCRTCQNEWQRARYAEACASGTMVRRRPPRDPATHCRRGHELTPDNTIIWKGFRRCRACNIAWRAENDDHRARFRMASRKKAAARFNDGGGVAERAAANTEGTSLTHSDPAPTR